MTFGHDYFGTGPMGLAAEILLTETSGDLSVGLPGQTSQLTVTGQSVMANTHPDYDYGQDLETGEPNPAPSEESSTTETTSTGSPLPEDELTDPDSFTPAEAGCNCAHLNETKCFDLNKRCYEIKQDDGSYHCECYTYWERFKLYFQ
tara:strand:+ start:332 stop:772 length:441 start_codon:yes stop_codon:yes gene_type:complete